MSFCKNCGAELPSDSAFCPKCGARIDSADRFSSNAGGFGDNYAKPAAEPGGFYHAPVGARIPILQRNIVTCVLLTIVTCGIYGLVWFFGLVNDLNTAVPSAEDKTPGTVLLLSIVTCGIYSLIWIYKAGEKIDRLKQMNGEAPASSAALYLVLSLVGFSIVAWCLMQSELNKVAQPQ